MHSFLDALCNDYIHVLMASKKKLEQIENKLIVK